MKTKERLKFEQISNIKINDNEVNFNCGGNNYFLNLKTNEYFSNAKTGRKGKGFSTLDSLTKRKITPLGTDSHGGYYLTLSVLGGSVRLHRLVAFIKYGLDMYRDNNVNHIDGDRDNNRFENIEVCTHKANMKNAKDRGVMKGLGMYTGKLKEKDILNIKEMISSGMRNKEISEKYNINQSNISNIRHNKRY